MIQGDRSAEGEQAMPRQGLTNVEQPQAQNGKNIRFISLVCLFLLVCLMLLLFIGAFDCSLHISQVLSGFT